MSTPPLPIRTAIPPTLLRMIVNQFLPGWWTKGIDSAEMRVELAKLGAMIEEQRSYCLDRDGMAAFHLEFDQTASSISEMLLLDDIGMPKDVRQQRQLIRMVSLCLARLYMVAS